MLNEEDLKINLKRYLKDKTDYAILIDGVWGIGKTFFIKSFFKDIKLPNCIMNLST